MKEYHFKNQNNKGGLYFLLVIFGPFLTIFPSLFLLDDVSWIFWISVPLTIFLMAYGLWKFHKTSRSIDTITIDNEGFTSKDYGRVLFTDIHSIPPYGALQAPPPSMRIRLHNRKKLVWIFNPKNPKAKDDVLAFNAFREALLERLKQQTQTASKEASDDVPHEAKVTHDTMPQQPEEGTDTQAEVIQQLESHKKRDTNYKYIAIPVGLAFAVMAFVRTCGEDMIREQKNKEFEGIRKAILTEEADYQDNVQKAIRVARTQARSFGPIHLFTNDPESRVEFIPDISKDPYTPEIEVFGLRRVEDNKKLEAYIAHPDSVDYLLMVSKPSLGFSTTMQESVFHKADSTAAVLYFAVYNPHESLPGRFRNQSDTAFRPIQYATSIQIPKAGKLKKQLLENMDFASVRAILQKYEGTYFYMAAKEQDGFSPKKFEALKKLVSADFEAHGMATDTFQSKIFNEE